LGRPKEAPRKPGKIQRSPYQDGPQERTQEQELRPSLFGILQNPTVRGRARSGTPKILHAGVQKPYPDLQLQKKSPQQHLSPIARQPAANLDYKTWKNRPKIEIHHNAFFRIRKNVQGNNLQGNKKPKPSS
jgi:hypothetical protein